MNKQEMINKSVFGDRIGEHPHYGKHKFVCHMCGSTYDIAGKMIFESDQNSGWEGICFEFPICLDCLLQGIGESMERMDDVMLRREIEKEKMMEKIHSFVQQRHEENMEIA